jgi:UDP-2-acetamido-2,6-beta-L-arabino-hexul-4-ose reductase
LNNPYGESKRLAESLLFNHNKLTGAKVLIYRLPNVFGKWCRPNYKSVVATFCYNIANDLPIIINDPKVSMHLVYIDDVVNELINALEGNENSEQNFCSVSEIYHATLDEIASLIHSFKKNREVRTIPNMSDMFSKNRVGILL